MRKKNAILLFLALSFIFFYGCDMSVNRSIHVQDGEKSSGLTTVNGSVHVGARCRVDGSCRTVNGGIHIGDDSRVRDLDTVNGRISIGANVQVDGNAATVNGSISCASGSKVHGRLGTVNGRIELKKCQVDEDLSTVNGDVLLTGSLVRGAIVIKGRRGRFSGERRIEIRIEDGSVVEGGIDVRDPRNQVEVHISKDSVVKGKIENARVIGEN